MGIKILDLLDKIVSGPFAPPFHVFKAIWDEEIGKKSWEDFYVEALSDAVKKMQPSLEKHVEKGEEIGVNKKAFIDAIRQDLAINFEDINQISENDCSKEFLDALVKRDALILGGHNLSEEGYKNFTFHLIQAARGLFYQKVIDHEGAYKKALFEKVYSAIVNDPKMHWNISTKAKL